jgi:hypothetical protein
MTPLAMRGHTGINDDEDVWKFEVTEERWEKLRTVGKIPPGTSYHAAATYQDGLWVHAGCPEKGTYASVREARLLTRQSVIRQIKFITSVIVSRPDLD